MLLSMRLFMNSQIQYTMHNFMRKAEHNGMFHSYSHDVFGRLTFVLLFDGGYISNDGYVHALNAKPNDFLWPDEEDSLDMAKENPFDVVDDEELVFRFYVKDHLGNNRMVIDSDGNVLQRTDYYPFGMPFYEPSNANNSALQQYKYNGKELDKMHGLNTYDYGARQYNPVTARWDRMDPLAEKYYSVSPYVYCAGNPISYVDLIHFGNKHLLSRT